jgi:hypothetical protein
VVDGSPGKQEARLSSVTELNHDSLSTKSPQKDGGVKMEVAAAHGVGRVDCDFVVEDIEFFCVYLSWKYIISYIVCIRQVGKSRRTRVEARRR